MKPLAPRSPEDLLPATQVLVRYHVSDMTLFRWLKNQNLNFPKPLRINNRRYWRLSDLQEFERQQINKSR